MSKKNDNKFIRDHLMIHTAFCFSIAYDVISDYDEADDIVQEVWIKCWNNIDTVRSVFKKDGKKGILRWLNFVTFNAAVDLYRKNAKLVKNKRRYKEEHNEEEEKTPSIVKWNISWIINHHLSDDVMEVVNNLPKDIRSVLILRCVYDQYYREIAEDLGISEAQARSKMELASSLIKVQLDSCGNAITDEESTNFPNTST